MCCPVRRVLKTLELQGVAIPGSTGQSMNRNDSHLSLQTGPLATMAFKNKAVFNISGI